MSAEIPFTRENLDTCLKELAKEFRKLNGKSMPAEIILVGGAAILVNYGFREMTLDIDAVIIASSAMKEAINRTGDRLGLPNGWLNMDFFRTSSYSDKLSEISVYYKTFSNILTVRTVSAEYLIAMKLMSGRQFKNDLSDVVGILWEHQKNGRPISQESIKNAISLLYKTKNEIPESSIKLLEDLFTANDYNSIFNEIRSNEIRTRELMLESDGKSQKTIYEADIDTILEKAREIRSKYIVSQKPNFTQEQNDL